MRERGGLKVKQVPRDEILYLIDHHWMVENPDVDEYAFLFELIQERHRTEFERAFEHKDSAQYDKIVLHLSTIAAERDRAEEILYWLYRDSHLRQEGITFPDAWESLPRLD
jgi:hypothetical protein